MGIRFQRKLSSSNIEKTKEIQDPTMDLLPNGLRKSGQELQFTNPMNLFPGNYQDESHSTQRRWTNSEQTRAKEIMLLGQQQWRHNLGRLRSYLKILHSCSKDCVKGPIYPYQMMSSPKAGSSSQVEESRAWLGLGAHFPVKIEH
nr:protein TIFY 10A-like [Ipomoea batatas]